jgi:hypothetical protein
LQPGCLATEITKGLADRLPRLGCGKEPSAHRAELAEDRVVVLKASITRVVACFGAGQVVDAVAAREPLARR